MEKHRFGTFIHLLRKEKGLTQKELAEALGVTDKAVSRWENGNNYPDIEIIQSLAVLLDVSVNELLQGQRIPEGNIKTATDKNIVAVFKKIKRDRRKCIVAASILLAVILVLAVLLHTSIYNMSRGIRDTYLKVTSHDTATILSCIDGYIVSQSGTSADLHDIQILIHGDKTVENMHIAGATIRGATFLCSVYTGQKEFPQVYIYQDKEEQAISTGITSSHLVEFINAIDFHQIDSNFFPRARYDITAVDICQDDHVYGIVDGQKGYMYHPDAKRLVKMKQEDSISGPCAHIEITKYNDDGTFFPLAHIFWKK